MKEFASDANNKTGRATFNVPAHINKPVEDERQYIGRTVTEQWLRMADFYIAMREKNGDEFVSEIIKERRDKVAQEKAKNNGAQ